MRDLWYAIYDFIDVFLSKYGKDIQKSVLPYFVACGILFLFVAELQIIGWFVKANGKGDACSAEAQTQAETAVAPDALKEKGDLPDRYDAHAAMEDGIFWMLGDRSSVYSIYFLRPDEDASPFIFQSRPTQPASMIKLFVLAKGMQDVKDGRLTLEETLKLQAKDIANGAGVLTRYDVGKRIHIRRLMELMIAESDNTATNVLIEKIGMEEIERYIQEHGYQDTHLRHKMMIRGKGKNSSSARDIGTLLTKIYRYECVGESEDKLMIRMMKEQTDQECFPKALPGWTVAHKTGEVSGSYADGGICFGKKGDFILVTMCEDYTGRNEAVRDMRRLASWFASSVHEK